MKRARWWAIAGLLCACGVTGCVQLPSRGLFIRRATPTDAEETRADESSDSRDEDETQRIARDKNHRDRNADPDGGEGNQELAKDAVDRSRGSQADGSTGGLFGVSSQGVPGDGLEAIVAPPPKRRSPSTSSVMTSVPPAAFNSPPDVRELRPSSAFGQTGNTLDSSPAENSDPRGSVMTADYETAAARSNASDIELVAAQRRAADSNSAPNPWDRFRNLTNNLDTDSARTQPIAEPQTSRLPQRPDVAPAITPAASSPMESHGVTQPPPWAEALTQRAVNNTFNGSAGVAATSTTNSPELWPRTPGAANFNSTASGQVADPRYSASENWKTDPGVRAASAPPNMQWVNAEQSGSNAATNSGFNFPGQANSSPFASAPNVPANIGMPEGAPATIAPFVTSPELERLITQTTVEAAALIPGDNDIARQLYLRKHVQLRLLHLIAGQMDRALQPVPGIDPADQEFWQQMLWGMANYFDTQGMPDSSERATQTIAQLKAASARLQEKARLELHNVAFCHKISGFGNYQRFKRDDFTPGQPVLLYAEVANFKSEPTSDGQYRTLMKSTLEVLEGGPTGRLVETLPLAPSEDRCRNQRRDYYHSYEFALPQGCNPGPHTLRLRVEDQLGKKTATTMLNFTVQ